MGGGCRIHRRPGPPLLFNLFIFSLFSSSSSLCVHSDLVLCCVLYSAIFGFDQNHFLSKKLERQCQSPLWETLIAAVVKVDMSGLLGIILMAYLEAFVSIVPTTLNHRRSSAGTSALLSSHLDLVTLATSSSSSSLQCFDPDLYQRRICNVTAVLILIYVSVTKLIWEHRPPMEHKSGSESSPEATSSPSRHLLVNSPHTPLDLHFIMLSFASKVLILSTTFQGDIAPSFHQGLQIWYVLDPLVLIICHGFGMRIRVLEGLMTSLNSPIRSILLLIGILYGYSLHYGVWGLGLTLGRLDLLVGPLMLLYQPLSRLFTTVPILQVHCMNTKGYCCDIPHIFLIEASISQQKITSTETTNIPYAQILMADVSVIQSQSKALVCSFVAPLSLRLRFLTFVLGMLDIFIRLGYEFCLGNLRIIVKLNSPIRPLFLLVGVLFNSCSASNWWNFVLEHSLGALESQGLLLALAVRFNLRKSFVVIGAQGCNMTSLADVFRLRESPIVWSLLHRVVNPERSQHVRRYISFLERQQVNSLLEKFYPAITRALNGLLRAALLWSYFGKCKIYVIKHLDPIEGFHILGNYHRVSMLPEDLSFYLSYVILSRLPFYLSFSWFVRRHFDGLGKM